jgi:voltage-gated potassium channel
VLKIMGGNQNLTDHVVVCGVTNVSESVMDELHDRGIPFLMVEHRESLIAHVRNRGCDVLVGEAGNKEILRQANLRQAQALIAARDSDAENMLIAVTARELRDKEGGKFRILVRVEDEENIEKARRIGADEVISPSTMGGRMLAARAVDDKKKGS